MFIGVKGLSVVGSAVGNISGPGYDSDAEAYIDAVESADGEALETEVKEAYNNFFVGLKDDGLLADLSACCLLLGARTIAGALTPLVPSMPTPTNNNFVSGDYSRTTGLKGDASTKYLDTNLLANADGQDDFHLSVYETELHNTGGGTAGILGYTDFPGSSNAAQIVYRYNSLFIQRAKDNNSTQLNRGTVTGYSGIVRSNSANFDYRYPGGTGTITGTSTPAPSANMFVFANNLPGTGAYIRANCRATFYSFGAAITLADLDSRVSTLVTEIGAALP
jgi:hypothetical protein